MTDQLTSYDIDILRALSGEHVEGLGWGAAMSECIEFLEGRRLVEKVLAGGAIQYRITEAGRQAIENPEAGRG